MTNTINTQKANETKINGNCKGVRDITNNVHYDSMTIAAAAKGVRLSSLSYAVKYETPCKGSHFVLESELYKRGDKLCEENAKANVRAAKANERADKAEAKLSEMEAELAEYRKWKAEQEAKREAEEKHKMDIEKAKEKVARRTEICERIAAQLTNAEKRKMEAEIELEALMDKEVM